MEQETTLLLRSDICCAPRDIFDYNIESQISLAVAHDIVVAKKDAFLYIFFLFRI